MSWIIRFALAAVLLIAGLPLARGDEKAAQKYLGTWGRPADDHKVVLEIQADTIRCTVATREGAALTAEADWTVSADGCLTAFMRPVRLTEDRRDQLKKRGVSALVHIMEKTLAIKELESESDNVSHLLLGSYSQMSGDKVSLKLSPVSSMPVARSSEMKKDTTKTSKSVDAPSKTPSIKIGRVVNSCEDLRLIELDNPRWFTTDQPSHLTYDRIHGGIQ